MLVASLTSFSVAASICRNTNHAGPRQKRSSSVSSLSTRQRHQYSYCWTVDLASCYCRPSNRDLLYSSERSLVLLYFHSLFLCNSKSGCGEERIKYNKNSNIGSKKKMCLFYLYFDLVPNSGEHPPSFHRSAL